MRERKAIKKGGREMREFKELNIKKELGKKGGEKMKYQLPPDDVEKLLNRVRKYCEKWGLEFNEPYHRRLFEAANYVCPKCFETVSYLREDGEGEILGCDHCLSIQGY